MCDPKMEVVVKVGALPLSDDQQSKNQPQRKGYYNYHYTQHQIQQMEMYVRITIPKHLIFYSFS